MNFIIAGYILLFVCTPIAVRRLTQIHPFEYTRGFMNLQSFTDLAHVGVLTSMIFTGNTKIITQSIFVYFFVDILFNSKAFIVSPNYLIHHLFTCSNIYIANKYYMDNIETLSYLIWLQETALIPIIIIDILRMQSLKVPITLYFIRAAWYLSTRLYTYGFFFYNFKKHPIMLLGTPLILHNANVFRLQIQSMRQCLSSQTSGKSKSPLSAVRLDKTG